jgi:hypothetical protein
MRSSLGGKLGRELTRLGQMATASRQVTSYRTRTSLTTQGVHREPIAPPGRTSAASRPALIVDETLQWLKCTFDLDYTSGETTFIWVAKPRNLRVPLPVMTPSVYAALNWGNFSVEDFVYRNAFERLRRFANPDSMMLGRAFTLYEAWPTATNRANIDTYAALAASVPFEETKIGAVDWIYDFQVVYPFYTFITGTDGVPFTVAASRIIDVIRLHPSDVLAEVPEDATFAGSVKYRDTNSDGRRWTPKHTVFQRNLMTFEFGGAGTVLAEASNTTYPVAALPTQFNDQLMAATSPAMATFITLNYWTELQP